MKHSKRIVLAILTLVFTLSTWAETAYILNASGNQKVNNGKCAIYAFDVNTPWIASEVCYADTLDSNFGIMGCLAGDIYYAYMNEETESGATITTFNSLNMTTGKRVIISTGSFDLTYGIDMCYEEKSGKLFLLREQYVIQNPETEEGYYVVELCTIDPKTGKPTNYATLPEEVTDYNIGGITSDGNGGIYMVGVAPYELKDGDNPMFKFWYKQINLYQFNVETKTISTLFKNEENAKIQLTTDLANSSLGLNGGVLYLTAQSHLITLDLETKTTTVKTQNGSGEAGADDAQLFLGNAVGICFAKSTKDAEPAKEDPKNEPETNIRMVKVVETYGDHMGERVGTMTHKTISLYDGENRLQREATYGYSYADAATGAASKWEIEYFKGFTYNEAGQLVMSASEKYGIHDGTDLAFINNLDTVMYTYDEAGRLIKEELQAGGYSMLYEYNEAGQKVKEIKQVPDYYDAYEGDFYNVYEITYSDFNAFGMPDSVHSTGMNDTDKYTGAYTYDQKGRKTAAHTRTLEGQDLKIETWTYSDDENKDTVMVHWVHEWFYGFDMGEKRTIYTYDNGNTNRTKEQVQTLVENTWVNEPTYTITELSEMNPEAVATLEVVDGKLANQPMETNSAVLTITLPNAAVVGTIAFDVYRHGIFLGRLNATNAVEGKLTYLDEGVKNGTYDYYVQTVLINELLETEEALNISNVVNYKHYVELPAATDIRCTAARLEDGIYYATIKWTAPVDTTGLGFKRYNVMLKKMKAADNGETDGQSVTWEVNCGPTGKESLYIQTVYKYGKVNSETIDIDCQTIIETTGIGEIEDASAEITASNGIVRTTAPANMVVYNIQGIQMGEAVTNTCMLDLKALPVGIYLVKVETASGIKTVKVKN